MTDEPMAKAGWTPVDKAWSVSGAGGPVIHVWWDAPGEPAHEQSPTCACGPKEIALPARPSPAGGQLAAQTIYLHQAGAAASPPPPPPLAPPAAANSGP